MNRLVATACSAADLSGPEIGTGSISSERAPAAASIDKRPFAQAPIAHAITMRGQDSASALASIGRPTAHIEWITIGALCGFSAAPPRELLERFLADRTGALDEGAVSHEVGTTPSAIADGVLSRRQRDCLLWLAQGEQTKQISDRLGIADGTVSEYIDSAKRRLSARTRPEAVAKAILRGYITPR
jgi:DNA-binding CsgD family transcriptional regulator